METEEKGGGKCLTVAKTILLFDEFWLFCRRKFLRETDPHIVACWKGSRQMVLAN